MTETSQRDEATTATAVRTVTVAGAQLSTAFANSLLFTSKHTDALPALEHIRMTVAADGSLWIEATERHTLIGTVLPNAGGKAEAGAETVAMIHADDVARFVKMKYQGAGAVVVTESTVRMFGLEVPNNTSLYNFPETRRLWDVPARAEAADLSVFGLSAPNMARIAKVKPYATRGTFDGGVRFQMIDPLRPLIATWPADPTVRALVMPYRVS